MKAKRYCYGISTDKYGKKTVYKFESKEERERWLRTETYSFADREYATRKEAYKAAGNDPEHIGDYSRM